MGVVNLGEQRASRQVLGNVRMGITPDLSKQWKGLQSIGDGISDLAFAIPRAINTLDAAFERDAENEANKLYSAYLTQMEESLNSPGDPNNPDKPRGLFLRAEEDDEAAKTLQESIKTAREKVLETIGYNDASKRTQEKFKLRAQSYDFSTQHKANGIMTARFQFSEKANATSALDASTRVTLKDPTQENIGASRLAFLSFAKANGYTEQQTMDGMVSFDRNLAMGLLMEKATQAQTPEEVEKIQEGVKKGDVSFLGGEDVELGKWIQKNFESLHPSEKKTILSKLTTREATVRDNQNKVYREAIIDTQMKMRNGEMTATQLKEKLDGWKKAGVPIQFVDDMDKLYHAQYSAETGQEIIKLTGGATDMESDAKTLELLDAMTPEQKKHPEWVRARLAVENHMGTLYKQQQLEESEIRYNMAVYQNGPYMLSMEESIRILDNADPDPAKQGLLQRGLITQEQAQEGIKKIKAREDARIQPILQGCFSKLSEYATKMGQAGEGMVAEVANVRWVLNGTTVDIGKTISGYAKYDTDGQTADEKRNIAVLSSYVQKAVDKVVEYAQTHPEATAQDCENFFGDIIYPILPDMTAYQIKQMAPATADFSNAKYAALDTVRFADSPKEAIFERAQYNPTPGVDMVFYSRGGGRKAFENPSYDRTPMQQRVEQRAQTALQKQKEAEAQAKAKAEAEAKAKAEAEKKAKEEEEAKAKAQAKTEETKQ